MMMCNVDTKSLQDQFIGGRASSGTA